MFRFGTKYTIARFYSKLRLNLLAVNHLQSKARLSFALQKRFIRFVLFKNKLVSSAKRIDFGIGNSSACVTKVQKEY